MTLRLGGTTIKSWFQYRCERKTRHEMEMGSEVEKAHRAHNTPPAAWTMAGMEYENRVIARLVADMNVRVIRPAVPHGSNATPRTLSATTLAFLTEDDGQETYAAQVNLGFDQPASCIGGSAALAIGGSIPDLIRRIPSPDGPPRFQVIDIKATRKATSFHRMQVAFYALVLRSILAELGERQVVGEVHPEGAVWHIPEGGSAGDNAPERETFSLVPYANAVVEFCRRTAPRIASRILTAGQDDTFFHVYYKCEQCAYLRSYCGTAIGLGLPPVLPERRDISAVAGLSQESKRALLANGIHTVAQLAQCGSEVGQMDGAGWALSRRGEMLVERARALRDDAILRRPDACTFLMPPRVDVAVYLVADFDPLDDMLVTLGYRIVDETGVRDTVEVLSTSERAQETAALIKIFGRLQADLAKIDAGNAAIGNPDAPGNRYVHIFVYETTEAITLQNAVRRHLDNNIVRTGLLNMIRLFPPDELIPEPELRGMRHLPAAALRSVIEQLFALPVTVAYDLRQVSHALHAQGRISTEYAPEGKFLRPFSSLLSIDVSRELRMQGGDHAHLEKAVGRDVRARLDAMQAITQWLLADNAWHEAQGQMPFLRLDKKPFRFQKSFDPFSMREIDTLRALELLENRAGLLETLVRLANPPQQRREARRAIGPMRMVEPQRIRQLAREWPDGNQSRTVVMKFLVRDMDMPDIRPGTFGLVLSDGATRHLLDQALWPGLSCGLRFAATGEVTLQMHRSVFCGEDFQEMLNRTDPHQWWLDQVFVDVNSPKSLVFLNFLNAQDAS
ncbi:PD-(D/E)XK nuclease family protein [Komagataeibacter melomenusus]